MLLYTVYYRRIQKWGINMNIIISNSSMQPIYEQMVEQVKAEILAGKLLPETKLPSVRELAKDLRISAFTVKKAYDTLEQEGFVMTIHGKGSFVAGIHRNMALEEQRKELERDVDTLVRKAKSCGVSREELQELLLLYME